MMEQRLIHQMASVERWCVWQCALKGPESGNPFTDHTVRAVFAHPCESKAVDGYYDGDGVYRVSFMPSFEGVYTYALTADFLQETLRGSFTVTPAREGNHGPVRVAAQYHFAYEDGTPYHSVGTTCYVWTHQSDEMIAQTLETLASSCFNKIRFCVMPKHYDYNLGEPRSYPFEGTPMDSSVLTKENFWRYTGKAEGNHWDLTRFDPRHFRHLEKCIAALCALGIEADIILLHPYDRWGFSCMTREEDERYIRYCVARFAAYRNVWWSLANEYDLMPKSIADWEHIAATICACDPYQHLRSIHNCVAHYDYTRPWVTHCSIQRQDLYKTGELVNQWCERYRKPVVMDEIAYEGNIQHGWGSITGEEMTRRCWETALRGGYPGHGETVLNDTGYLWWSHGGRLYGESERRLAFLLDVMKQTPGCGLRLSPSCGWDEVHAVPQTGSGYHLYYYSFMRPSFREFHFAEDEHYEVTVLDTWAMTREVRGVCSGHFTVKLPAKQYMAIQLVRVEE